jgi:hypothetical protein
VLSSWVLVILLAAGCAFRPIAAGSDGSGAADAAASDGSNDADDATGAPPFCDAANPDLVACFQFQGDVLDASQYANHATAAMVSFAPGPTTLAMNTTAASDVQIGESTSLDMMQMTIEMWLRVDVLPLVGQRVGIVDNNGQYSIFIHPDGIECFPVSTAIDGSEFVSLRTGTLTGGEWAHLACTYDGATLIMYKDGIETGRRAGSGPIRDTGTAGTGLAKNNPSGDALTGAIDELRIWRVARTEAEICAAAGC